jgi:hypothetical protein
MKTETVPPLLAGNPSKSAAAELQKLAAENARLATEVRHARAIADGIELGLGAAQKRLVDAKAENAELRRKLRRDQGMLRRDQRMAWVWPKTA